MVINGKRSSPRIPDSTLISTGVSARAWNDAWAVGNENAGRWPRPLIEHWDGSAWTAVKKANDSRDFFVELSAVSGNPANANDVWAVGTLYNIDFGYAVESFAEHWDGTSWGSPGNVPPGIQLFGVSTLSNGEAWAVGSFTCPHQCGEAPVIDHWDGTQWDAVTGAFQHRGILLGTSATSSNDVWAIGWWAQTAKSPIKPVIEHFDGQSWKVTPWVNPGIGAQLTSITAASPTDAWVAGSYTVPFSSNATLPLLEHWDGKSWTIVPAPSAEATTSANAITDISGSVIAVGDSQKDSSYLRFFFRTFGFTAQC